MRRRNVTRGVGAGFLALLAAAFVAPQPAAAAPGAPGAPGDPATVFVENFETGSPWQALTSYVSSAGFGYTASAYWESTPHCNGLIVQRGAIGTGCPDPGYEAELGKMAENIAAAGGGATSTSNHALAWYSLDENGLPNNAGDVLLQSSGTVTLDPGGRFVTLRADFAGDNCNGLNPPLLSFALVDGIEHPVLDAPVDPCNDPRAVTAAEPGQFGPVRIGRYLGDRSVLIGGTEVGFVLRDMADYESGNDGAVDNIALLDVTPQLDADFATPGPITAGDVTTLRYTITNTSELLAKSGWSFTSTLPVGMVVAGSASSTCDAVVAAATGTVAVAGGTLADGQTSCAIDVPVRAVVPGTYSHGPDDVTSSGLNPPGVTSVEYTLAAPPPPDNPPPGPSPGPAPHGGGSQGGSGAVPNRLTAGSAGPPAGASTAGAFSGAQGRSGVAGGAPIGGLPGSAAAPWSVAAGATLGAAEGGNLAVAPLEGSAPVGDDRVEPSALANGVPSIAELFADPERLGWALAAGLVWTLLLVVATHTLEKALKARYSGWTAALHRIFPWVARLGRMFVGVARHHWAPIVGLTLVNVTLLAFVDPDFGFTATSARLLLSLAAAGVVAVVVPYWVTAWLASRFYGVPATVRGAPWGLVIGAVGVLVSRAIGFLPGLLTGSVVRLGQTSESAEDSVRVGRTRVVLTLAPAPLFWWAANAIDGSAGWWHAFAHEAAVAATVVSLTSMLIELLPLASSFIGGVLFQHARTSWAILMAITAAAFALVVVPQPEYWLYVGDRVSWWITVAAIAMLSIVATVLAFHWWDSRKVR